MKTISIIAIAASILFSSAAYANPQYPQERVIRTITEEAPKPALENVPVKQNPMDYGRLNESPIRGEGRISVVHNEPVPDDKAADIHKARWLLQDAGYQCFMPGRRR